jgi:hypothetical protein
LRAQLFEHAGGFGNQPSASALPQRRRSRRRLGRDLPRRLDVVEAAERVLQVGELLEERGARRPPALRSQPEKNSARSAAS